MLAVLLQTSTWAREIHVAKTGDDNNTGSEGAPYLTIGKAAAEAVAGDVILIRDGTYREWVKPARGGTSDTQRITYCAYPGHNPVIKGSEQVTSWVWENGNVWRADIQNSLFGADNPYVLTIGTTNHTMSSGARLTGVYANVGKSFHLGDVYLDGEAYSERFTRTAVDTATKTWYTEQSGGTTRIWANFGGANPNTRLAEILVRECVFAPTTSNVNFITVDGLTMRQAACGWAENNNFQSALIKTRGGRQWVIQRCLISDARCSGISSATHTNSNSDISVVGRHVVRNNTIERCGAGGISGMYGWSASIIEGNLIQNINPKREFGGYEGGGIKVHNTADLLIRNNIIRNVTSLGGSTNAPGIWIDWRNQGVRITGNVIYGIEGPDSIFFEINRGINLVDNNILIDKPVRFGAERTVFVHNLMVNAGHTGFNDTSRSNNYYQPHTLIPVGTPASAIVKLASRDFNNIILNRGLIAGTSGYQANFNVYYNGANRLSGHDANSIVESSFNTAFSRTDLANGVTFQFNASRAPDTVSCPPITYDYIGAYTYPNGMQQGMADRDANQININQDMLGNERSAVSPMAGPFETLQEGQNTFTLYAGRTPAVEWTESSQASLTESGTLTVTARLSAASSEDVTVPFSVSGTASAGDYTITASPITIPAGETTGTAAITITTDSIAEPEETVILTMGTPTNATAGIITVHTATITDNAGGVWLGISGDWSSADTWTGGIIADGTDFTGFFTGANITADRIINLDTNRTIGNITFTDATTASNNLTISGANILTLDRTSGTPIINVTQAGRTLTISSQISGADGLQKNGAGILSLSGSNDYTGPTIIQGGILDISNNTALGATSGNTTIAATGSNNGPRLTLGGNLNSAENLSISGSTESGDFASVISSTSGTNTLSGNITLASPSNGIRLGANGGNLVLSGTIGQTGTARTLLLQATGGANLTVNNAISNGGAALSIISQSGSNGSVTLHAASGTGIGATTIGENGLLRLGVTNAIRTDQSLTLGFAHNFTGSDRGTFDLAGFNQTVNALIGTRNSSNVGADSIRIVTNSATGTSILTVGNGNGTGTFNGVIQDGGVGRVVALTKTGTGTQTLVGDSNYSGVTTINGGTIVISHANALGSTAGNTTIAATGATTGPRLALSGGITSPENITITGATETSGFEGAIRNTSGNNTLGGNIVLSSPTAGIRLDATAGTLTFSGNISQTGTSRTLGLTPAASSTITVNNPIANNGGQLTVACYIDGTAGTVVLNGVNATNGTGIGNTTVFQGGTLKLGVSNALNTSGTLNIGGSGSAPATTDIGTFDLAGFNQTVNALVGTTRSGGNANSTRRVTNSATGSGTSTLTVGNGNGSGTFNGVIQDGSTAKIALIKTGSGTQTLAGVNTYSGDTTINQGTLTLNNANPNNQTSTVVIAASGATLNLAFAGTDTVDKLFIGATQLAAGVYGSSGSPSPIIPRAEITGTGTLTVTTGPVIADDYTTWRALNGAGADPSGDHDNDGVENGVEYFLGGPNGISTGFTPLPGPTAEAGTLSVTWTKGPGYNGTYEADFVVETSDSLTGAWTTETLGRGNVTLSGNNVKYTFPAPLETRKFVRLKVNIPP